MCAHKVTLKCEIKFRWLVYNLNYLALFVIKLHVGTSFYTWYLLMWTLTSELILININITDITALTHTNLIFLVIDS